MGSSAAPSAHGHLKPSSSRRPLAASVLLLFVLLAVTVVKLLPPGSLYQTLSTQQLPQATDCLNAAVAGDVGATSTAAVASAQPRLRILMLSHDLTLTGAPQVLYEVAAHLQTRGHTISFLSLRGGELKQLLAGSGISYSLDTDVQLHPLNHSTPVDPASFDVVVVNTAVTFYWLRDQVEAWGLSFLQKAVWWIHEHPLSAADGFAAEGASLKRHLMARCGAVAIVSTSTWRWWEAWALDGAHQAGLDYSPLVGRQESFGRQPLLPRGLPNLRVVRNPLPSWIVPLLDLGGSGGSGGSSSSSGSGSSRAQMPECSRESKQWPFASLRQHFRQLIGAADEDYVVLMVSANSPYKGVGRLVAAFARAWQQASSLPSGAPGRLLLVCVGRSMPKLVDEVKLAAASLQPAPKLAAQAAADGTAHAAGDLLAAVHLLDETDNSTQRLGWYAAADVHVLNSECESFGRVTVEGMAASLPQLATTCGGTLEIVQDDVSGLLHPPPSAGEAADAMLLEHMLRLDRRTAAGRALSEQLGTAGCQRVHAEFMPQQFFDASEALLQQVADGAAAADAAAAAGPGPAPGEGLTPGAAALLRSGWAAAFQPSPANQAHVVQRDIQWEWEELPPAPLLAAENVAFQSGRKLIVLSSNVQFNGSSNVVPHALMSVNLGSRQWQNESIALPADLAETHFGAALMDDRHMFIVAGQKGGECSPATTEAYRLDLRTLAVQAIPELPEPRYSPALAVLGDGHLHVFGGLLPDRVTPAREHWSLAINADGSTGDAWVTEPPLPTHLGGSHGTVIELQPQGTAEPALYYWGRVSQGAQAWDAAAGNYSCVANREWGDAALWSYSLRRGWRRHRDLPLPLLYAAGCTVKLSQDTVLVAGGQHFDGWLSRTLWLYNATEDSWARVGHAPVYSRGHVCGLQDGRLFMALGQLGQETGLLHQPGLLSGRQFWARLPAELAGQREGT